MPAKMKIRSAYTSLPSAERKVADYILEDTRRASLMVINDIAREAGVSVPSVTRLAKKLGYDGFLDFRVALASGSVSGTTTELEPLSAGDTDEVAIEKLFLGSMRCIEDTFKVLDPKKLAKLADEIIAASRTLVVGISASESLASGTASYMSMLGANVMASTNPDLVKKHAEHMKQGELLIAITRTGTTKVIVDAVKLAHSNGAKCVMISNNVSSPVSALCDLFFCTARISDVKYIIGRETNISQYVLLQVLCEVISHKLNAENTKY